SGLALLQKHGQSRKANECFVEAPLEHLQVAAAFHKFAEAAYTGPLLDFGRNPFVFPCAWLYRQGILTPWTRNRRPALDGDNWWRGHAAAFLKFVNLPPGVLRRGRVCQKKCEAAYFVVVLHHLRSVVIAVRGTETPEDLITDGLGRECPLSEMDLDGLINSSYIHPSVKQRVESSFPHYGHSGIVEAARDLYTQIEGYSGDGTEIFIVVLLVIITAAFAVISIITPLSCILMRDMRRPFRILSSNLLILNTVCAIVCCLLIPPHFNSSFRNNQSSC
ncbi:uncharacterized protein LOC110428848, partial [Herrania umbratica]|uniref:Uncharacterized protein LOC110428848 n=1 Tax=Herrania umbratica TaxID=108875 RepID=A0A6J1BLV0_9ROSI